MHGDRVIARDHSAFIAQQMCDLQRRGLADVVGVGFECQSHQPDASAVQLAADQFAQIVDGPAPHVPVDVDHCAQQSRVGAVHKRHVFECLDIFGKTAAAVAEARVEELGADAAVKAHPLGHLLDICPQLFADHGDLVDKTDLGGQEGVAGIFDHFGGAQVGHQDARPQRQVELGHFFGGGWGAATDHHPIRVHKVVERRPLACEFRAADHGEVDRRGLAAANDVRHPVPGADRNRALVDHDQGVAHGTRHRLSSHAHIAQVGFAIYAARGADTDKKKLSLVQSLFIAGRKVQTPSLQIAQNHLAQPWLVDRRLATLQHRNFFLVDVEAGDMVAHVGKTGAGRQPDIAGARHHNVTHLSVSSCSQNNFG